MEKSWKSHGILGQQVRTLVYVLGPSLFCIQYNAIFNFQVEKQEKKKKKTGRAKRRMQYNRRYVNVVQGFGRRKGPNANS